MPCGLTAVLLGWPQVSCMSQPANMAAANQGAPFSRFLAFATPLVHQFMPYFSWTQMKLDLLKNPTHPPPYWGGSEDNEQQSIINVPSAGRCLVAADHIGISVVGYMCVSLYKRVVFLRCSSPVTSDSHQPLYGFKLYFFGMGMYRMNRART